MVLSLLGESHHPSRQVLATGRAAQDKADLHHGHQTFGEGRQSLTAGKAEVVEVQVVTGQYDRYFLVSLFPMPAGDVDIHKGIWDRLEEHLRGELHPQFLTAQGGDDTEE